MADPLSIVGSAVSIIGLIDVVSKSLSTLSYLRWQWKGADLILLHLTSQLTSLKAALFQIKEWMDIEHDEIHDSLTTSLHTTLQCCGVLANLLEGELAKYQTSEQTLRRASKAKLAFSAGTFQQVSQMVDSQTSALHMLLTVCRCKTTSKQQEVLEDSGSQMILGRVQQDSASLVAQHDTLSLLSGHSDNLSKLSMKFDFDAQLFGSRVYAPMVRCAFKKSFSFRPSRNQFGGLKPASGKPRPSLESVGEHENQLSKPKTRTSRDTPRTKGAVKPVQVDPRRLKTVVMGKCQSVEMVWSLTWSIRRRRQLQIYIHQANLDAIHRIFP